jgi:hypothetical protein
MRPVTASLNALLQPGLQNIQMQLGMRWSDAYEGVAGCGGHFAVRADFAGRDGEDDAAEGGVAILIGAEAITQEGAAHFGGWEDPGVQRERGESGDRFSGLAHE